MSTNNESYWTLVWRQFRRHPLGLAALAVVLSFIVIGVYAPLLASSKPFVVSYDGQWYFPLGRYLFYEGFFTKRVDIFFNLLMFTLPVGCLAWTFGRDYRAFGLAAVTVAHLLTFLFLISYPQKDPASSPELSRLKNAELQSRKALVDKDPLLAPLETGPWWAYELKYMSDYGKLNLLLRHRQRQEQHDRLQRWQGAYAEKAQQRWLAKAIVKKRRDLIAAGSTREELPESEELRERILRETDLSVIEEATALPTLWKVELANEAKSSKRHQMIVDQLEGQYTQAKNELMPLLEACRKRSDRLEVLQRERVAAEKKMANIERIGGDNAKLLEQGQQELEALQHQCDELTTATDRERSALAARRRIVERYDVAKASLEYISDRRHWLDEQSGAIKHVVMPFVRQFHWEDDAGGEQSLNQFIGWNERTRINRKDLLAALFFGVRISLVVGILAVSLAMAIGVPIGSLAGFYGGRFDIIVSRLLEIWESMPTFFMLLLVVAITQSKSIFLVIGVVGLFGWTGFSRFIRGEVFKQRNLAYVEACQSLGFTDRRTIFFHILPNAIPPLLTLLPFAIMGAITSEAGLSFLGLGEEGSCSWGVLMDEGRTAFPGESYLLWPPAVLLTILLIAIALVGDALRDSLDPKMRGA